MTSEEIKERVSVRDVLQEHGAKIRGNMCSCPFHKDVNPSMAIYDKAVKCFSCGFSGDVFSLTMKLDNCSFKDAFKALGGTYGHMSHRSRVNAMSRREAQRAAAKKRKKDRDEYRDSLLLALMVCDHASKVFEPFSDDWCYLMNKQVTLELAFEDIYLYGNEESDPNVYRTSREINNRFLPRTRHL